MNEPIFSTYKDKPVIILNPGEYQFMFGLYKAGKIIENFAKLKAHALTYFNKAALKHARENKSKQPDFLISTGPLNDPIKIGSYRAWTIINNIEAIKSFIQRNG
jgi:hypothetical protein